jgi:hypothetical protein
VLYVDGHVVLYTRNTDRRIIRARLCWHSAEVYPDP